MATQLIDEYGRRIRKLRVSLLDACQFRCFYCMPRDARFMSRSHWMSSDEIEKVCRYLVDFGLEQIRLTGGEPTIRPDFREIVLRISELPLKKLGLTTNGEKLHGLLEFLSKTNCKHLNISLDSLSEENFEKITRPAGARKNVLPGILSAVFRAKELGFQVKINTVLMKGVNDHELFDFVDFSRKYDIEVRFLEMMKIGEACQEQTNLFMPAHQAIETIMQRETLIPQKVEDDSTSFNFKTQSGAKMGFIASESKPFCGGCSRWRLSADGFLRACLMSQEGISVRNLSLEEYPDVLGRILKMKPPGRIEQIGQNMNQIGG